MGHSAAKTEFLLPHWIRNGLLDLKQPRCQKLDNCIAVFRYCAHGSSFGFVSALAFFKDKSTYKHAFRVCNGGKFNIGPHCLVVVRAEKSTIKKFLRGVNPQVATELLKISLGKKRRKKDDSSSSSSSESDGSDSSSSDDSNYNRKEKRKSNKCDGEKKKRAHSLPSLINSRDDSHDMKIQTNGG